MGVSNQSKRNVLHLAALHASTEVMDMLTAANMFGLNAVARDKDGHSPDECFLKCRSAHCAVARKPFDVERRSWARLMKSALRKTEISLDVSDEDEETGVIPEDIRHQCKDACMISETSSGSTSEEEYVDAYGGDDKKNCSHDTI